MANPSGSAAKNGDPPWVIANEMILLLAASHPLRARNIECMRPGMSDKNLKYQKRKLAKRQLESIELCQYFLNILQTLNPYLISFQNL